MRVSLGRLGSVTRLMACAVVALLVVVLGAGLAPARADAQKIDGAITSGTLTPTDPVPGESVELEITWSVPDGVHGGDWFELALPEGLNRLTSTFDLKDPSGNLVATAAVSAGVVKFTLTDFVETHNDVHGTAYFWVRVSSEAKPGQQITVTLGSTTTTIIVGDPGGPGTGGPDDLSATKYGHWRGEEGYGDESDFIDYVVRTPVGPFDTVTFKDTLGGGQAFVCHETDDAEAPTVTYYKIDPNTGAYLATQYPDEDETTIDCTEASATLTVTVKDVPEEFIAFLTYTVRVTEYLDVYKNSALITTDRTTDEVPSKVERMGAGGDGEGDIPDKPATVVVTKTADPISGTLVGPEDVVTYTLAFDYEGQGAAVPVEYTDHLGGVLDDADFVEVTNDGGLSVTGPTDGDLHITGSLSADTAVSYSVKVKPAAQQTATDGDCTLRNQVVKKGEESGPTTEHPVQCFPRVHIAKVDEYGVALGGAQFALTNAAGTKSVELTPKDLGGFVSGALEPGDYRLEEVAAPEGYQLLAEPVLFTVDDEGVVALTGPSENGPATVSLSDDGVYVITVTDRRAYTLPLTGGSGDVAFWVGGAAVLSIAAASLVVGRGKQTTRRRRAQAVDQ
ncbi:Ig-like domain-containing protein [Xylanimonas ulmi]|uniref:LPXTG-motif cell wall-anchored protein n=1 Tax=Xylanimonas ulmi TaxID=228973 RepID=A0A4Q7M6F0_9MICO|nr:Ig-like domain-containing protein [Xylanibacterium ulmi]RZS62653.1 hypothetical protein EV386_2997 [Xylanibacterium ulmi]